MYQEKYFFFLLFFSLFVSLKNKKSNSGLGKLAKENAMESLFSLSSNPRAEKHGQPNSVGIVQNVSHNGYNFNVYDFADRHREVRRIRRQLVNTYLS